MSNVLITGDRGYIGSILADFLITKGLNVSGYDLGLYDDYYVSQHELNYGSVTGDVRNITSQDFKDVDSVVWLAALSNDPLGEFNASITMDINSHAAVQGAKLAKKAGVKHFIFLSSQSIYGVSKVDEELDEDKGIKSPVTAYASAKWEAEQKLIELTDSEFTVTFLRPSTVFGASPNLRCDIVYNNFIGSAITSGTIEIKSDGSPWRPIIHVNDLSLAIYSTLLADRASVNGRAYNVGVKGGNYTVKQLAMAASSAVENSELTFTNEHTDPRTYKVSFDRINTELGNYFQPFWGLENGGIQLRDFFMSVNLTKQKFNGPHTNRLLALKEQIQLGKITNEIERI